MFLAESDAVNPAKLAYYYYQSGRTYGLPRAQLERLQVKRLRNVLDYAYREVPGFRDSFANAGFDPTSVTKVEDLRRLPLNSRPEILRLHEAAQKSGRAKGGMIGTTSGTSTGRPSLIATSEDSRTLASALRYRRMIRYGMRPWSRVATLWAPDRFWRRRMIDGELRPTTGARRFPMSVLGRNPPNLLALTVDPSDPAKDGKALADFRPEFINGKPSHLRRIARICGTDLKISPKALLVTGEVVTDTGLKEIRRGFGAKVLQHYGSSGFGGLASDCVHESGLHAMEDYKVCEVLKEEEPVAEGEVGELVVTFLYRDVVPAVRFRTGDYVRLGPMERCECGSSTRRFKAVVGREDDCIIGRSGTKFLGLDVAEHIESAFDLRDFQLIQNTLDGFTLLLRSGDMKRDDAISRVAQYLTELIGMNVVVDARLRDEEDLWLKARPVVCRIPFLGARS